MFDGNQKPIQGQIASKSGKMPYLHGVPEEPGGLWMLKSPYMPHQPSPETIPSTASRMSWNRIVAPRPVGVDKVAAVRLRASVAPNPVSASLSKGALCKRTDPIRDAATIFPHE